MSVFDFSAKWALGHTFGILPSKGMADERRTTRLGPDARSPADARISPLRPTISRQLPLPEVHLLRSVPLSGLRPVDPPREPARHRDVPSGLGQEAVSRRPARPRGAKHAGQGQREARLAHLGRLGPGAHRPSASALCAGILRGGVEADRLRLRLHDHRLVPAALSLGALPPAKSGHQAPHAAGPARQHSVFCPSDTWQNHRCPLPRCLAVGAGGVLRFRPRLHRFCPPVSFRPGFGFLCHARQARSGLPLRRVAPGGQEDRSALRPDPPLERPFDLASLPGPSAPHRLCRPGNRQTIRLL